LGFIESGLQEGVVLLSAFDICCLSGYKPAQTLFLMHDGAFSPELTVFRADKLNALCGLEKTKDDGFG
jgi:hypothetical protein